MRNSEKNFQVTILQDHYHLPIYGLALYIPSNLNFFKKLYLALLIKKIIFHFCLLITPFGAKMTHSHKVPCGVHGHHARRHGDNLKIIVFG